jgi:hypothetical protein
MMELRDREVSKYNTYKNSDFEEILICCGRENLQMKKQ